MTPADVMRIADSVLGGKTLTIIGIDPGLTGAIAVLEGNAACAHDMPVLPKGKSGHEMDVAKLLDLLRFIAPTVAYVERQQPRPGNGAKAAFSSGYGYGCILTALTALGIPFVLVTPQAWHKVCLAGEPADEEDKKRPSLRVARRLFPLADLGRRKDAGRAEALLIAEYGRRNGGTHV